MKKFLLSLVLVAIVLTPLIVFGQLPPEPSRECKIVRDFNIGDNEYYKGDTISFDHNAGEGSLACMINIVYRITNTIFTIMMVLVMFLVLYGGVLILTAGGNEDNVGKGKKFITYAMAGLAIALLAWVAPFLVIFLVG